MSTHSQGERMVTSLIDPRGIPETDLFIGSDGIAVKSLGFPVWQLFHFFPSIKSLFFEFEINFDLTDYFLFYKAHNFMFYSMIICIVYLIAIFAIKRIMKNREKFQVKRYWAVWNLMLSVFSFIGAIRTVPHLISSVVFKGLHFAVCYHPEVSYGHGACGFWTMLFIISKIPELGDTFFIVLGKRPLIFLHWYHHMTVLLFCWHSYFSLSSAGLWFIAMNYSVHAVMYLYYFLTCIGIKPTWDKFVTVFQISQMITGVALCSVIGFFKSAGYSCVIDDYNYYAGLVMYFSYFILFFVLALDRYVLKSIKKPEKQVKTE